MGFTRYLNDQGIDIARGLILGTSHINKFGSTAGTITSETTIWDGSGTSAIYPYPAAGLLTLAGETNTDDDGEAVEIQGLDADYNLITETINVGSTGLQTFSRVFRAFMVSTDNSQGINITQGATLAAKIISGAGQTQMSVYTIPAGKTGYLVKIHGNSDRSNGSPAVQFKLKAREFNSIFRIKGTYGTAGGDQFVYEYPVPLKFDEKTDIRIDATASSATIVSSIFDVILVDN